MTSLHARLAIRTATLEVIQQRRTSPASQDKPLYSQVVTGSRPATSQDSPNHLTQPSITLTPLPQLPSQQPPINAATQPRQHKAPDGNDEGWTLVSRRRPYHCSRESRPKPKLSKQLELLKSQGRCYRCLDRGHTQFQCRNSVRCLKCHGIGHLSRHCTSQGNQPIKTAPPTAPYQRQQNRVNHRGNHHTHTPPQQAASIPQQPAPQQATPTPPMDFEHWESLPMLSPDLLHKNPFGRVVYIDIEGWLHNSSPPLHPRFEDDAGQVGPHHGPQRRRHRHRQPPPTVPPTYDRGTSQESASGALTGHSGDYLANKGDNALTILRRMDPPVHNPTGHAGQTCIGSPSNEKLPAGVATVKWVTSHQTWNMVHMHATTDKGEILQALGINLISPSIPVPLPAISLFRDVSPTDQQKEVPLLLFTAVMSQACFAQELSADHRGSAAHGRAPRDILPLTKLGQTRPQSPTGRRPQMQGEPVELIGPLLGPQLALGPNYETQGKEDSDMGRSLSAQNFMGPLHKFQFTLGSNSASQVETESDAGLHSELAVTEYAAGLVQSNFQDLSLSDGPMHEPICVKGRPRLSDIAKEAGAAPPGFEGPPRYTRATRRSTRLENKQTGRYISVIDRARATRGFIDVTDLMQRTKPKPKSTPRPVLDYTKSYHPLTLSHAEAVVSTAGIELTEELLTQLRAEVIATGEGSSVPANN
ncbi:hypothetical protein FCM35_KLT12034 [Carex littledalei]|uniref:CCHC-type domain-containing protein n=1 Tax=Carex littledalei TaxID=544730 RepID=A0A833QPH6_9POAL|nr:hypothetical protein FCM35_KLT12034 [Carex littledalei]